LGIRYNLQLLMCIKRIPEGDIFGETEDEVRADEEQWEKQFAASRDKLRAIAGEAAAEYRAGRTKPKESHHECH